MPYEKNLWAWLHSGIKPLIATRKLHICRIENQVSVGYPDVEGCLQGKSFHIELKGCLRPANPGTPIDTGLGPAQALWLKRRWDAGGSSFVLLRVGTGRTIKRYMVRGDRSQLLVDGFTCRVTESDLLELSIINADAEAMQIIEKAAKYRQKKSANT